MHDARTFVVHSHVRVRVCGCVRVCECVKGLLRRFPSPVRVRASKLIEYASDINTLGHEHTHTHMHGMPTYTHVYRVCERAREMCGEQESRRETTLCAARFDFGAAVRRRQPIAKLQPADWTNSSGPNGPQMDSGCPRTQGQRYRWTENTKKKTETETKTKPKACPEVSRMDRSKLLENVKNYIICAEKCAYIFSSLFLSAPAPSSPSPSPTFALTIC